MKPALHIEIIAACYPLLPTHFVSADVQRYPSHATDFKNVKQLAVKS